MSITITTDTFCDVRGCGHWTEGTTGRAVDKVGARAAAKAQGWSRRMIDGALRDICPRHGDDPNFEVF